MNNISLSGLFSAKLDLSTTSNNIANVNSFGFKESRAEFSDSYSSSLYRSTKNSYGSGSKVSSVPQLFHEGASINSENPLDLRIEGKGFFAVSANKFEPEDRNLTRNGAFHLNKENYLVTSNDAFLLGFANDAKKAESNILEAIKIPSEFGKPIKTTKVVQEVNLQSTDKSMSATEFDLEDEDTYNFSTSTLVYDSLGQSYPLTTYYLKEASNDGTWNVFYSVGDESGNKPINIVDGNALSGKGQKGHQLNFNNDGTIQDQFGNVSFRLESFSQANVLTNGANTSEEIEVDFENSSQFASPFHIKLISGNGAALGHLTKIEIKDDGEVVSSYSNGKSRVNGTVALLNVNNPQGLEKVGNSQWKASSRSGKVIIGEPNNGDFGKLIDYRLESSNADITNELVDLISAQRNFQANSRALDTYSQNLQSIMDIK